MLRLLIYIFSFLALSGGWGSSALYAQTKGLIPASRALSRSGVSVRAACVKNCPLWTKSPVQAFSVPLVKPFRYVSPASKQAVFPLPGVTRLVMAKLPRRALFPGKDKIDAVIFDLDGTLLDSLPAWEHSGSNFLRTQGIVPPQGLDEELVSLSLMDGARLLKKRFSLPQTPEEILALTLRPIRERYYRDLPAKPGVPELLLALKAQGIKLCVATASDRELAEAALKRLHLSGLFDFIITCDEVGVGKRSPAVYEQALERLGTRKARTLVAEDALHALKTAKQAGFLTAGIADESAPQDQAELARLSDYYVPAFTPFQAAKN